MILPRTSPFSIERKGNAFPNRCVYEMGNTVSVYLGSKTKRR